MRLNALLMCRDSQTLRVLAAAMDELQIDGECCASAAEALDLLAQGYYSALAVDFDLASASLVVRMARMAPAQRRPVVFAIIGALTDVASTFQSGANFVLYKPLALAQVLRSLRAGRGFMRPDRRRSPRQKVQTMAYLRFGEVCPVPVVVLDVNEQGLAVQAAEPLPAVEVPLHFILPGAPELIEGFGDIIWADESGRAGILFTELSTVARKQLKQWLAARIQKTSAWRTTTRSRKPHASLMPTH